MIKNPATALRIATISVCLFSALNLGISTVSAQSASSAPTSSSLSYADLADVSVIAPLVVKAQITDVIPLSSKQSPVRIGTAKRLFVEAKVLGLIRGDNGIAPVVSFLYDAPVDAKGKTPKLRKKQVLLFAQPGSRAGQLQLVSPSAMVDWTAEREATVKSIASELVAAGAAPRIDGVGDAFHVAGTIAGEGETQIFLKTETGDPVSLSIIRRPGEPPRWAVALGEIVDEAAATPKQGTLLWYRLACGLPSSLPAQSVRTLTVQDAEAARADYKLVLDSIGACGRTVAPR